LCGNPERTVPGAWVGRMRLEPVSLGSGSGRGTLREGGEGERTRGTAVGGRQEELREGPPVRQPRRGPNASAYGADTRPPGGGKGLRPEPDLHPSPPSAVDEVCEAGEAGTMGPAHRPGGGAPGARGGPDQLRGLGGGGT